MDNREAILSEALHLFYVRGYDAVGVQEIVDAAGVTKPTLYYYFGSKKGLLESLFEHPVSGTGGGTKDGGGGRKRSAVRALSDSQRVF